MKRSKSASLIIMLAGFMVGSSAWAHRSFHGPSSHGFHHYGHHRHHHHHHHTGASVGVVIGVPLAAPWYYRAPSYYSPYYSPHYYYYSPMAVTPTVPPVYIERQNEESSIEPQAGYWYYCSEPQGYYPYVRQCNRGWQQVPARPPGS